MTYPNNNPTGINQYSRHSAGVLRTKTGKLYHGTTYAFPGAVKPMGRRGQAWATTSVKHAKSYANSSRGNATRLLQVAIPAKGAHLFSRSGNSSGYKAIASTRPLSVIRALPTLHKPSRRT